MSGGGAVLSSEIVSAFFKQGHNVCVVIPDIEWKDSKFEPELDSKIKIIRVKTPFRNNIKIAARLCKKNLENQIRKLVMVEKFDFIFTIFHPFHRVPHAVISVAKKLEIPVLIKIDDAVYAKSNGIKLLQHRIEKISNRKVLQNANKILVANENIKKIIIREYGINNEKIGIIPNGIDTEFFKNEINQNKSIIIFSGVMYYHRGLDVLLNALPRIVTKFPDIKIVLLGNGPEKEKLQKITVNLKLTKNVEFKGWVDRKEIPNFLSKSFMGIGPLKLTDVTANALPIKILEYMASSLPILAIKGTLPKEVLEDNKNGYFVTDSEDLADKIIQLLDDKKLREEMGRNSLKMVQNFDWQNITANILQFHYNLKK